jgi:hypothetical protein
MVATAAASRSAEAARTARCDGETRFFLTSSPLG